MNKVDAERLIHERLRSIEAGFADCGIAVMTGRQTGAIYKNPELSQIHMNRVLGLFISIAHLKDDCMRWGKAANVPTSRVKNFCETSPAVALVKKVADTAKHGLGGRKKNNSLPESEIIVHNRIGGVPSPTDPIVDLFWIITDEDGYPHQSNLLLAEAMNSWIAFLSSLGVGLEEWAKIWKPVPLPPGWSVYRGNLPDPILREMQSGSLSQKKSF